MRIYKYIALFIFISVYLIYAQNIGILLDHIYDRAIQQQQARAEMADYSYQQSVLFIKKDGDGDIDEQSRRVFRVYARPHDFIKRILISAENYEDGRWEDVTSAERNKDRQSESQQFSLTEIVSPHARSAYNFSLLDTTKINGDSILHMSVGAIEKDEEVFDGELWFRTTDYILVKAALQPSETPMGVDSMRMVFDLHQVGDYWLPESVYIEAHISFLFFFKGSIETTIEFSDYQLKQTIPDSLISKKSDNF
jgi:hypothetical protein